MRALFFTELSERTFRLRMIPDDRNALLAHIEQNVRSLEQAVPFPCIKSETTLRYIQTGKDCGKFEVSLTITCEKIVSKESAVRFLQRAGFKRTIR